MDAKEAARDAAVGKAYAGFLVEIAENLPKLVMPTMSLIVGHLEGEVRPTQHDLSHTSFFVSISAYSRKTQKGLTY